jgi:hypothetical protein
MLDKLLPLLLEDGLLQFGRFERDSGIVPMLLNWEMLPAYPTTLNYIVELMGSRIAGHVERLVCPADSIPLGVGISLRTQIPLVYSRGKGQDPVHDLVGAYDVGHPAVMITNTLPPPSQTQQFIAQAQKVGLHIHQTIALTAMAHTMEGKSIALIPLAETLTWLQTHGHITPHQAEITRAWAANTL